MLRYGFGTDMTVRLRQLNRKRNYADFKEAEQNQWPGILVCMYTGEKVYK